MSVYTYEIPMYRRLHGLVSTVTLRGIVRAESDDEARAAAWQEIVKQVSEWSQDLRAQISFGNLNVERIEAK